MRLCLNVCESRHEMHMWCASMDASVCVCVCVCFPHVSILCLCMSVHPSNLSVPIPAETSALHVPPHTGRMPSRFIQLRQTTLPIRGPRDNVKSRSQLK